VSPPLVLLVISVVGAIVLLVAGRRHERLMLPGRPHVVQLELAGTGERLHRRLLALGHDGRTNMRQALGVDRWIIIGYVVAIGGSSVLSIWALRMAADGAWRVTGTVIAIAVTGAVVVAAVLDLIENATLTRALHAWTDPPPRERPANAANASARQSHRRASIATLTAPAQRAARAARAKFVILFALWPTWMVAVATVCVTHAVH
jgi:uncharacterized membrane protein YeaQ/YmgE (transglycosylase-associated protein family)